MSQENIEDNMSYNGSYKKENKMAKFEQLLMKIYSKLSRIRDFQMSSEFEQNCNQYFLFNFHQSDSIQS